MDRDAILTKLKEVLLSEFKLDPDSISFEKRLEDDLELDSLDAVDLLLALTDYVKEELNPTMLKDVKTIEDLVDLLVPIWRQT